MEFDEYLKSKKIDPDAYQASEPRQWEEFAVIFEQMHPKSFTMQKLNLINGLRRSFPLSLVEDSINNSINKKQVRAKVVRPMMKPETPSQGSQNEVTKRRIPRIIKPRVAVTKPVMVKPVMKPKVKSDQEETTQSITKESKQSKGTSGKPKMVRPVIKPRIKN